jgi:hypothetical protein
MQNASSSAQPCFTSSAVAIGAVQATDTAEASADADAPATAELPPPTSLATANSDSPAIAPLHPAAGSAMSAPAEALSAAAVPAPAPATGAPAPPPSPGGQSPAGDDPAPPALDDPAPPALAPEAPATASEAAPAARSPPEAVTYDAVGKGKARHWIPHVGDSDCPPADFGPARGRPGRVAYAASLQRGGGAESPAPPAQGPFGAASAAVPLGGFALAGSADLLRLQRPAAALPSRSPLRKSRATATAAAAASAVRAVVRLLPPFVKLAPGSAYAAPASPVRPSPATGPLPSDRGGEGTTGVNAAPDDGQAAPPPAGGDEGAPPPRQRPRYMLPSLPGAVR